MGNAQSTDITLSNIGLCRLNTMKNDQESEFIERLRIRLSVLKQEAEIAKANGDDEKLHELCHAIAFVSDAICID